MEHIKKLMTPEIANQLGRVGLYADEWEGYSDDLNINDFQVMAHFCIPKTRYHWFVLGGKKLNDEWLLWCYAHITCGELGIVSLYELENINVNKDGIVYSVFRDTSVLDTLGNMKKRYNLD